MIYQFYIQLEESVPLVWRRIIVPSDYTLYQLHIAIQCAFGWENAHLFQFSEIGSEYLIGYGLPFDYPFDENITLDATKTKMRKLFRKEKQAYSYVYDFGDYWKHRIILEKIEEKELVAPFCLDGGGACPPEDVGGLSGYQEMIKVLSTPRHPERAGYITWLGLVKGEKWIPSFVSLREVNKRLVFLG